MTLCFFKTIFISLKNIQFPERFRNNSRKYEFYKSHVDRNRRDVMSDFARINVFVVDSKVQKTEESPLYTVTQLFSDIGGQLGIWIGVSVITLTEVVELVIGLACECFRKKTTELGGHPNDSTGKDLDHLEELTGIEVGKCQG